MRVPARSLWFPALLLSSCPLPAQKPASQPQPVQTQTAQTVPIQAKTAADPFAAESFVIQHENSVFFYNADGTGYREVTLAVTVQSDAALRNLSVVGVAFAANSEKVEFHYVRVRRRDGSVVETPLSQAIEQPAEVTREAPFYSDLKQEQIPVRSLGVGDTLEWQARVVRTRAEAPGEFWGQESFTAPGDAVSREASVELRFPKSKAVTVWTNPRYLALEGAKPPTDTISGDERVVRWESSTLKPTAGPAADADKQTRKKHILTADEEADSEQGKLPSVAWTTFPSWAAVGAWYRALQGDRTEPTPEIKARVAELTAGKTTDEEKIRAVYAFDSAQIRYIGVAFGIGRYQPHRADDVLSNQYGDCKDKETLLASMLAVLGLHTDAVLIGSGIRFNAAVPSPGAFNHLIAKVELPDGHSIWLDPTAEVAPFRMLLEPLRNHEALVIPATGAATVERTPAEPPFAAADEWHATGTLDASGTSQSHIVVTFRGDDELFIRAVVRQVPSSSYDELGQKFIAGLGYAGTASHVEFSRPEDTADPLRFSFDYKREHSGDWDNHRIIAQLAPITLPTVDEKDPPTAALNLLPPRTEHSTAAMTLPEGWRAELPEAIHAKSAWATVDTTFRFDKGTVYAERTLKVFQQKVPAADWQEWKKFQEAASLGMESYIPLTHRTGETSGKSKAEPAAGMQELLNEAEQDYQRRDMKALASCIDRMKALDPKARRVQAWAGSLAVLHGHLDEAIADNRKELELYPDEMDRYEAIVWVQLRKNDKTGAEDTLRAWSRAAPDDPKPLLRLAALLLPVNPGEAVTTAQEAVAHSTEGTTDGNGARLLLGQAQIKAGQTEAGDKTLTALLHATDDPGMLNDAAYELANAKLELPLAEQSSRTAIAKLTEESKSWTLDESPQTLQQRSVLLVAAWDTMGWILYREGKPREAQPWIAAAWLNGQHDEVRDHLVEIQTALGPDFAHSPDAMDTGKNEQATRTFPLGKAEGRNGVGQYRVLLAAGKIERAEPAAEGKTLPDGEALLQSVRLPHFFPPGSEAHLVRNAMLNCHGGTCELIFTP